TLTYVVFFAILLSFLGLVFRQTIRSLYDAQFREVLNEEWAAVRGYLRIDKPSRKSKTPQINWYYDRDDPEEALIVDRLRQVYLLADANGNNLQVSPKYRQLPMETPEEVRSAVRRRAQDWKVLRDGSGTPYLIRTGVMTAEDDRHYYVSIGRSAAEKERILSSFTWYYSSLLPLMIISTAVLGWFMAGRALIPVNELAQTAQRITGDNLAVRIPSRGSGDELDRLIEAFNRMIERLDESFTQSRQFSTDVSHELRTPLTAIRGQLEVALIAATTAEHYQEAILNALQDVERLSRTIRSLLLLSQAESGQLTLQKQAVNFGELVADITEQFQIPAEGAHIALSIRQNEPVRIEADRIQIERLVSNLLSNAVKYTLDGGSIDVSVIPKGDDVELVIADTGMGISQDHLPYIFDRFYRVPSMGRRGGDNSPEKGLGLGLSFVAWIVKSHGGSIDVISTPGEGTTFTVRLPKGSPDRGETLVPVEPDYQIRV
ncbi:MAG: HAMP domain-containing protein, partial [Bryobacteraceae bacterium]|nr:HAMP domain-containing protein [Bryobacteraceae bacterium]